MKNSKHLAIIAALFLTGILLMIGITVKNGGIDAAVEYHSDPSRALKINESLNDLMDYLDEQVDEGIIRVENLDQSGTKRLRIFKPVDLKADGFSWDIRFILDEDVELGNDIDSMQAVTVTKDKNNVVIISRDPVGGAIAEKLTSRNSPVVVIANIPNDGTESDVLRYEITSIPDRGDFTAKDFFVPNEVYSSSVDDIKIADKAAFEEIEKIKELVLDTDYHLDLMEQE